ncbi:hypothetical protein UlMin_035309 [Ulmus minor]
MAPSFIFYVLSITIFSPLISSSNFNTLNEGSSLSVEKLNDDILNSPNGIFAAGFFPAGVNAYYFGIWFSHPSNDDVQNREIVWTANRDQAVNGKRSKLNLLQTSNLILTDAGRNIIWQTDTSSPLVSKLQLLNSGNLVLLASNGVVLWQSFDSPTDTLVPHQQLTRYGKLVSSRSQTNLSSGFYKLFFDNDNVLRLIFDNNQLSSVYWPVPWQLPIDAGRSPYNNSKIAVLDSKGNFSSSDEFTFKSVDYGSSEIQRRLKLDWDGNIRLYSRKAREETWYVSWEAHVNPCKIHGICGDNSLCKYGPDFGRKCSCLPGYKMRNLTDWTYGCEPKFNVSCSSNDSRFLLVPNSEYYGYDYDITDGHSLQQCQDSCLQSCDCKGFQYSYMVGQGTFRCYLKTLLVNGYQSSSFSGDIYLRLPKTNFSYYEKSVEETKLDCSENVTQHLARTYAKKGTDEFLKYLLWFACGLGGFELIFILLVWCLLLRNKESWGPDNMGHRLLVSMGFRRFSFAELKKATQGFGKEIGRGAGGTVYKGVLSDDRVAAIKRLNTDSNQGEAEFLAEVNTIGMLNHMNLIETWGYCAEGKHRLLVYEYLEHGSLKENLSTNVLDWKMRFEISLGTAKGLAYLHEECLEWVLHCDVKPQNILLDSNYQPKVADFGLSKLVKRGELSNSSFSRIRGTRGYMAPEWITNQPITSKADVYSYGIVVLEMLTGRSPTSSFHSEKGTAGDVEQRDLVMWVRETVNEDCDVARWMEKIIDPSMEGKYDVEEVGILLEVALRCVEEDKDARPTMRQVVEKLLDRDSTNKDN